MLILLFSVFLATTVIAVDSFSVIKEDGKDDCMADARKRTAERIINNMDPTIKPCDDFYRFSCGKFLKDGLPKGKSSVSSATQVQEVVISQIRELLEAPVEPGEHNAYKTAKQFYALCLKEVNSPRKVTEARTFLRSVGWPVLGGWREGKWTLHEQETKLMNRTLSGGGLFHVDLQPDLNTPRRYLITVDQPQLTRKFLREWELQRELVDMLELPQVRAYQEYMVDLTVMFGVDRQSAEHQLRDSLLFELDLEKIIDAPKGRHRAYKVMTLAELQGRAGWVDWSALLAAAVVPKSLGLSGDELVKVYEPTYLDRLHRIIEQHPKRAIANFLGWRVAEHLSLMLTPEMDARRKQFYRKVGLQDMKPWEMCFQMLNRFSLNLAVSAMYVRKYMTEDTKLVVSEMTSNIRDQMYYTLKAQDWMEAHTKTKALLKLCKMKELIGYPNELTDTKKMDEIYEGLNLDLDQAPNFQSAYITLHMWLIEFGYEKLTDNWVKYGQLASIPNAFYNPRKNVLQITAAFLQPPIFSACLPKYMYYSTIGTVAGHEITHGFDNNGLEFDADGTLGDWWDESSKMNFAQKGKCLLNQYAEYLANNSDILQGGRIFPYYRADNRSLGEIIADNGGLKLAYNAYQEYSTKLKEPEPLLPNLEQYTREQMFFISFANLHCSLEDIEALQKKVALSDVHPPAQFRVNGLFQNFPGFSEAFNCAAETNMNPTGKCSAW